MKAKISTEQYLSLQAEYENLKNQNAELSAKLEEAYQNIDNIMSQLDWLKKQVFGQKSEKTQYLPFGDQLPLSDEDIPASHQDEGQVITVKEHTAHKRVKKTYNELFENIPQEVVECPGPSTCPKCGAKTEHVAWEDARVELKYVPASFTLVHYRTETCKCPQCTTDNNEEITRFLKAKAPAAFLPGCYCSRELLAYIINEKFGKAVPLNRLEGDFKSKGVQINRTTMGNWLEKAVQAYLIHIYYAMKDMLLTFHVINADETSTQVLNEEGRKATTKSKMWVFAGQSEERINISMFMYSPTRHGKNAANFLGDYAGYCVCDGFDGYNKLKNAIRCGCFAHLRRKLLDVAGQSKYKRGKEDPAELPPPGPTAPEEVAAKGVWYINRLFALEHYYSGEEPEYEEGKFRRWVTVRVGMNPDQKKDERQKRSKPILDEFFAFIESAYASPKSKLGAALRYALNEKVYLYRFLEDGRIPISNNRAENAVRPYAVGRKNWMFSSSEEGAESQAILYSIVATARANGLDVEKYLEKIFNSAPGTVIMPW